MTTREEIQQLVATLPEGALERARAALQRLQTRTPPTPPAPSAPDEARDWLAEVHQKHQARMQERLNEMHQRHPERSFAVLGGGGGSMGPGGRFSRHSFNYPDGPAHVHETAIVHGSHEFVLIERIRTDTAAHKLFFVVELTGPDGRTARLESAFDTSSR